MNYKFQEQKIRKDRVELSSTLKQLDLMVTNRILHGTVAEYAFFSSSHRTFAKTELILGHEAHLKILKEQESYKICF